MTERSSQSLMDVKMSDGAVAPRTSPSVSLDPPGREERRKARPSTSSRVSKDTQAERDGRDSSSRRSEEITEVREERLKEDQDARRSRRSRREKVDDGAARSSESLKVEEKSPREDQDASRSRRSRREKVDDGAARSSESLKVEEKSSREDQDARRSRRSRREKVDDGGGGAAGRRSAESLREDQDARRSRRSHREKDDDAGGGGAAGRRSAESLKVESRHTEDGGGREASPKTEDGEGKRDSGRRREERQGRTGRSSREDGEGRADSGRRREEQHGDERRHKERGDGEGKSRAEKSRRDDLKDGEPGGEKAKSRRSKNKKEEEDGKPRLTVRDELARADNGKSCRQVCGLFTRCPDRSRSHLLSYTHPLDKDFCRSCEAAQIPCPELTLKAIFDWGDEDMSSRLAREEFEGIFGTLAKYCKSPLPAMTDEQWSAADRDGNGVLNFGEFADYAQTYATLPLGMEAMRHRMDGKDLTGMAPCSVIGCNCSDYVRPNSAIRRKQNKCDGCPHKKAQHKRQSSEIPFPGYWANHSGDFNTSIELHEQMVRAFQGVFDATHNPVFTRDRARHNPDNPDVPRGYKITALRRNENRRAWVDFGCRRAEALTRLHEGKVKYEVMKDIKTMSALNAICSKKGATLVPECNEWYLYHGTNPEVAKLICQSNFRMSCAGSNTGTLYGRGSYFAECITKADEYAKPNQDGICAVLLCRVIGGLVKYTDEKEPDPDELVNSCLHGPYGCVLGDREKTRNTFREFVFFDSEDIYAEYVIEYKRLY